MSYFVTSAITTALAAGDTAQYVDLARLACQVGEGAPQAPICSSILSLLELHDGIEPGETMPERFARIHVLVVALVLSSTPDVAVA